MLALAGVLAIFNFPAQSRADFWGGDLVYLAQILEQNIKHYYQLQQMIQQSQNADQYLRWLNAGIDNSIGLLQALPIRDEKVLADLKNFRASLGKVTDIYGQIPKSPEEALHTLNDQSVAESFRMANDFKDFSEIQEKNSEVIAIQSRDASPKGAMRMQAETSAQILKTLSQLLRLNTQMLKLQGEQLAMKNKSDKAVVANFQKVNNDLGQGFLNLKTDMKLTRF